jgi:hypothetical protein
MPVMRVTLGPLLAILLAAGCGNDDESFGYEGEPGQPTDILLAGWTPLVAASLDDGPAQLLLADTGAPRTEVDPARFNLEEDVKRFQAQLNVFGLSIRDFGVRATDLEGGLGGLLGADVLAEFQFTVDYQGSRAYVFDGVEFPIDVGADVEPGESVAAPLMGAGTRIIVDAEIEGTPAAVLIDTGASYVAVDADFLEELGGADRPELCCQEIITYKEGIVSAPLTRLRSVSLGGVGEVESVPAMEEHPSLGLLAALSDETGEPIRALIGGSYLREFLVTVDYHDETLWLERYSADDHIDRREFIGPGFDVTKNPGEITVSQVWEGTAPWEEGIRASTHRLHMVDGIPVVGKPLDEVQELLHSFEPGTVVSFEFGYGANEVLEVDLPIEDLLPEYR